MKLRQCIAALSVLAITAGNIAVCNAQTGDSAPSHATLTSHELPDSVRLAFDWSSQAKNHFTVDTKGNQVSLHFDKPVELDLDKSLRNLKPYVNNIESKQGGTTLVFTLSHPAEVRDFLTFDTNGVDLIRHKQQKPVVTLSIPASPAKTLAKSSHPVKLASAHSSGHHKTVKEARNAHTHRQNIALADAKPISHPVIQSSHKPVSVSTPVPSLLAAGVATAAPAAKVTQTPLPVIAQATYGVSALPLPTASAESLASLSPAAGSNPATPASVAAETPADTPDAAKETISLPLQSGEAFAAFIRNKTLWIVTDAATKLPAGSLNVSGAHYTGTLTPLSIPNATVMTLPLTQKVSASVESSGIEGLRIVLQPTPVKVKAAVSLSIVNNDQNQASITMPAGTTQKAVSLADPQTGENLQVIPLSTPGNGIANARSFVEFKLLQTAQGIVVQKIADNVSVSIQKGQVQISAPKGLAISPEITQQVQDEETDKLNAHIPSTLFPYGRWKLEDEKNLLPTELKLTHNIVYGSPDVALKSRLKLLGLYLAEGLFPEARGMADDILRVSYKSYVQNKIAASRGAAFFFMYRFNEAERDFSAPELMNSTEAGMWRTLCKELLGESTEPFNFVANYDNIIRYYPPVFIQKLAIIAADRSINRKDYEAADAAFDLLRRDNLDEPIKKYIDFLHAKVLSETHHEEEAAKIWSQQMTDADDTLIRSRAEFSYINMMLKQNKMTHDDAERRLEKLRIVWRGDNLEVNILTLLGSLYNEDKQYAKALRALRDIVLYYPDIPEAVTTAQQMEDTFIFLYNKGGAEDMPPLEALALFYEFRDLVPLGKDGDLMIRNLADRLVNIDLLDRAALLLNHQVKNRLEGDERSRVGARLALIYLLNHQPKDALDTLKTTGYGELPPELQLTRLHLTAQALAQQGQGEKAIDVLANDNSAEGTILRLSIYWDNKDWPNVVATAEEILGNRNDPSAPLTPEESDVLLKLATAYVYEHDSGQIQYLRDYFTPLLKNNPNKDSFLFITSESGAIDYQNLSNLDQDIGAVKSFLDTYRDKVKKNGLSKAL